MKTCRGCGEQKPLDEFKLRKGPTKPYRVARCHPCRKAQQTEQGRKWRARHPARAKLVSYSHSLMTKYGLTLSGYIRMYKYQNGVCAICDQPDPNRKLLHVDHDHLTNVVRGLLCGPCNRILGQFSDNPSLFRQAAAYLENPPRKVMCDNDLDLDIGEQMDEPVKYLDEDEALAVFAALDAPLYLNPDDSENIAFIADLQDDAHDLMAEILGFDAE